MAQCASHLLAPPQTDFLGTLAGVRAAMQAYGLLVTHQELEPGNGRSAAELGSGGSGAGAGVRSSTTVHHVLHDAQSVLIYEKDGRLALCLKADLAAQMARVRLHACALACSALTLHACTCRPRAAG